MKPGDIGTEAGFAHALRSHIHGVTRESGEVRTHTLQSLQMLLHANQNMIHRMVMGTFLIIVGRVFLILGRIR